jgi:hypothetical protein
VIQRDLLRAAPDAGAATSPSDELGVEVDVDVAFERG